MNVPGRPTSMLKDLWARISTLPSEVRDRVLERACILHYEGKVPFPDADEQALLLEAGISIQQNLLRE